MKIFNLGKIPEGYDCYGDTVTEFGDYDLEDLKKIEADAVFYWYATGCFDGTGQILFRVDKKWYLHDCGHCSCYGPTEHIILTDSFDTLEEVKNRCSDELWTEVKPLVEMAKSKRFK